MERLEVAGEVAGEAELATSAGRWGTLGDGDGQVERLEVAGEAEACALDAGEAELGDAGVLEVTGEGGAARPTKRRNPPSRRVRGRGGWVRG